MNHYNLEYKNVSVQKENFFLHDINFQIKKGSLVGISGESGSGKSTLIDILNTKKKYTGDIYISSYNLHNLNESDLLKKMFLIKQISEDNLDPLNKPVYIFEEIRQIRKKPIHLWRKLVEDLIKEFGLKREVLYKNVFFLSGGEKQRICIIKGILLNPNILILDESLSALDQFTRKKIIDFLIRWKTTTQNSILYITHSIKDLFICDEVLFLHKSSVHKIKDKGNIKKMLKSIYSKEIINFFLMN